MVERTVDYLKDLGVIGDEQDLVGLTTRNLAIANPNKVDISQCLQELQATKDRLDGERKAMLKQRDSMKSIFDGLEKMDVKIDELKQKNKLLFDACLTERNRQIRNRLLLNKMENEEKVQELNALRKATERKNAKSFKELERMRKAVDVAQMAHDAKAKEFKERLGVGEDSINQLLTGIYNKFQDEILKTAKRNEK